MSAQLTFYLPLRNWDIWKVLANAQAVNLPSFFFTAIRIEVMLATIYLKNKKRPNEKTSENLVAMVYLEVVPRGIYQIGNKLYEYVDQPKFIISGPGRDGMSDLIRVELMVEPYEEPTTYGA